MSRKEKYERYLKQPEYLKLYARTFQNPEHYVVYLESTHYAIIRVDGGTGWNGMTGNHYYPSTYTLINRNILQYKKKIHEGRVTKKDKINFQKELERLEKKYYEKR